MRVSPILIIGIFVCLTVNAEKEPIKYSDEKRGKRTLLDIANGGYHFPSVRRAGYDNEPKSYLNYNGQQPTNQYAAPYNGYPQYLEAPEPIIEIIIQDANETTPQVLSSPVVTKKKKEKVQVFYVNYKKDKDNKLHLETPIASLSNDDNEDEQDEVIDYPVPVTVSPLQKSTTLRTIIHPDSEKYQSNSGIHVTFGNDDTTDKDHNNKELNSESVNHEVIALPSNKAHRYSGPSIATNFGSQGNRQYELIQNQQQPRYNQGHIQLQHQQVPNSKPLQHLQNQNQHQNLPNRPFFNISTQSVAGNHQQKDNNFLSLKDINKHAQYFVSHNQQYNSPQQQQQQQQRYTNQQQKSEPNLLSFGQVANTLQQIIFPTSNPQSNAQYPTHQSSNSYNSNKFGPTQTSFQHNSNQRHQLFNQPTHKPSLLYNKQPQYIQQPQFTKISPTLQPNYVNDNRAQQFNYSPKTQSINQSLFTNKNYENFAQQNFQQLLQNRHQQDTQKIEKNNNFNNKPSQDTELLKSIPKYEHHITETIPSSSNQNPYQPLGSKVIHDIPAPNLGRLNSQPNVEVKYNSAPNAQPRGHYNTASTLISQQYATNTEVPIYDKTQDGKQLMIVTPMPLTATHNQFNVRDHYSTSVSPLSVTNYHKNPNVERTSTISQRNNFELPEEVPDDLRKHLLSSGILDNAQISVLDYDKTGGINLEELPKEHLQHFFKAGGGQQISESNRVVSVVKPNDLLHEKKTENVKSLNSIKTKQISKLNEENITKKYIPSATLTDHTVQITEDRKYHRYLPLKINGAHFPIPKSDELKGKKIVSVVVLSPVLDKQTTSSENLSKDEQTKNERFIADDLVKFLIKKPTTENFNRWLDKEAKTDVESQSIVLLVTKSSEPNSQEIFLYDNSVGEVNKLNGEFSSAFVNIAEENASAENLENASIVDQNALQEMIQSR